MIPPPPPFPSAPKPVAHFLYSSFLFLKGLSQRLDWLEMDILHGIGPTGISCVTLNTSGFYLWSLIVNWIYIDKNHLRLKNPNFVKWYYGCSYSEISLILLAAITSCICTTVYDVHCAYFVQTPLLFFPYCKNYFEIPLSTLADKDDEFCRGPIAFHLFPVIKMFFLPVEYSNPILGNMKKEYFVVSFLLT